MDASDFEAARNRLDGIAEQVRDKDLSLEKSLDLYEEAVKLASTCSNLVDKSAFSAEEKIRLQEAFGELESTLAGQDGSSASAAGQSSKDPEGAAANDASAGFGAKQGEGDDDAGSEDVDLESDRPQAVQG